MTGVLKVRDGASWVPVGAASHDVHVSPTAPTDPAVDLWWDSDEVGQELLTQTTGDTRYALGTVAYAQVVAIQASITTVVDLTGLTVTFTAVLGRSYKFTFFTYLFSSVMTDNVRCYLTTSANAIVQQTTFSDSAGGTSLTGVWVASDLSGSVTYKLRALRFNGTGNITLQTDSTRPAFILVEDIGIL